MGVFYRSEGVGPALKSVLQDALTVDCKTLADPQKVAETKAAELQERVSGTLAWERVLGAVLLLAAVLVAAIYTGRHQTELKALYDVLVHAFEILFGGVVGLITGEAVSRR
jgi:hypothetical protein